MTLVSCDARARINSIRQRTGTSLIIASYDDVSPTSPDDPLIGKTRPGQSRASFTVHKPAQTEPKAVNATPLAFAGERRAAAPLLPSADRDISSRRAHSSKPAAAGCGG